MLVVCVRVQARIVDSDDTRSALLALDSALVAKMAEDIDTRRKIRPLMDLIAESKRALGRK
jgi:hypothetical protein